MTPLFIVGSQRSGTTLLRLLLNAHSKLAIPEEGTFWMPFLRTLRKDVCKPIKGRMLSNYIEYIKNNDQFKTWQIDIRKVFDKLLSSEETTVKEIMESLYLEYAKVNNKIYWGDKTPSFFRKVKELSQIFPTSKFIHIIRDGRDIFLSMRAMVPGKINIAVAALEWKYKIKKAKRSLRRLSSDRWIEIRYEDLLKSPEANLTNICAFLGIDYEDTMMDFWKSSHKYIGRHHSDLIFKPISTVSAEKWKRLMTKKEINIFENIAGDILEELGYEVSRDYGIEWKIKSLVNLSTGLPRRGLEVMYTASVLHIACILGLRTSAAGGTQSNKQS